jgi:uncharacterized protein YegL
MKFKLEDIKKETKNEVSIIEENALKLNEYTSEELSNIDVTTSLGNRNTEFVFFIDSSTSMSGTELQMEKYFLDMIDKYKDREDILVTVVTFASDSRKLYYRVPIKEIDKIKYLANGGTKLFDTVVNNVSSILNDQMISNVVSSKTIVTILTDGEDNESSKYTEDKMKSIIEYTKSLGWEYILLSRYSFISADYGIEHIGVFDDYNKINKCFNSIDKAIASYIDKGKIDDNWNEELVDNKRLSITKKW